jgi:hypothetical protein
MEMKRRLAVCLLIGYCLSIAVSAHADVVDVRDVENPARTPFVVNVIVDIEPAERPKELGVVPAGKRAVIEFISMQCGTVPPDTIRVVQFFFPLSSNFIHYFLPISQQGGPGDFLQQSWVAGQVVRIYADAGPISLAVGHSSQNPGTSGCEVSISGHTIDVNGR